MVGVGIEYADLGFVEVNLGFTHTRTEDAFNAGGIIVDNDLIRNVISTVHKQHGFFFVGGFECSFDGSQTVFFTCRIRTEIIYINVATILFGFIYFIVAGFRLFAFGRIMDMGSRSRSFFSSRLRRRNIFVVLVLCCIIIVIGKVGYFAGVVLCRQRTLADMGFIG